jgi:hypothetical protein
MGPKGEPDTKMNWSTDCRMQDELQLCKGSRACTILCAVP